MRAFALDEEIIWQRITEGLTWDEKSELRFLNKLLDRKKITLKEMINTVTRIENILKRSKLSKKCNKLKSLAYKAKDKYIKTKNIVYKEQYIENMTKLVEENKKAFSGVSFGKKVINSLKELFSLSLGEAN